LVIAKKDAERADFDSARHESLPEMDR
jgi:hypothetical protein